VTSQEGRDERVKLLVDSLRQTSGVEDVFGWGGGHNSPNLNQVNVDEFYVFIDLAAGVAGDEAHASIERCIADYDGPGAISLERESRRDRGGEERSHAIRGRDGGDPSLLANLIARA
jgi:hypothetical protein